MKLCRKIFGNKQPATGVADQSENPEPHVNSLPKQSNIIHQNGNLNPVNSSEVVPVPVPASGITDQNENPEPHGKLLSHQEGSLDSGNSNNVNVQPEACCSSSVTRGEKNGPEASKAKDFTTPNRGSSTISRPATRSQGKREIKGIAIAEPPQKSPNVGRGKARGVTISEPSTRITRGKDLIRSVASERITEAEKAAAVSEPSTSYSKVDKGKAKVGVPISEPSESTTGKKGKAKTVTIWQPKTRTNAGTQEKSTKVDKGKAKVGVTISEPLKTTPAEMGKAKGVTIREPKTRTNAGTQEVGKGKKVENSQKTTTPPIQKPSGTKEKSRAWAEAPKPVYHIVWDGFNEASESPRQACPICEKDLTSLGPWAEGGKSDDEYGYYFQQMNLPEVGVLACGHVFHALCLESITPEDQLAEPPCLVCLSSSIS